MSHLTLPDSGCKNSELGVSRIPFATAASVMFVLCLKGGFFGPPGEHFLEIPVFFSDDGTWLLPAGRFIVLYTFTWIACLAMLVLYPRSIPAGRSCLILLFAALICRVALLPHPPSDDIFRYLWEGRLLSEGISPYKFAPNDPFLAALAADDPYHASVNHPYSPAIYPPFVIFVFSLIGQIDYSPAAIKAAMILFDLGTVFFLLRILVRRGLDPRWSILYAFNPVVLYGIAGQGHFDAAQNFFLMGALFFYGRKQWAWMFLFAGLAVQSKYIAAITLPFLANRDNIRHSWIAVLASVVPYVPLMDSEWPMLFRHLAKFGGEYAFNGSVHGLLRAALGGIEPASDVCKLLFSCAFLFGLWYFHPARGIRFKNDPIPGCFFSVGALLLLSPTVHFWYLAWIIPFVALMPSKSWMVLCLTICGCFIAMGLSHHTGEWRLPVWVQVAEWLPFYFLFFTDALKFLSRSKHRLDPAKPVSVSVVIPVFNEEERIEACVKSVMKDKAVMEVIVVDGGSPDGTVEKAKAAGAALVMHTASLGNGGGRGGQIHAGIASAKGDVVAIVHADTRISAPTFSNILRVLGKNPAMIGGAAGSVFDAKGPRFRLLELLNDFRMVFLGIGFGDQVQFFRRGPVVKANLFPNIPLMEDVEFSIRMNRAGRRVFLFGNALVSARRWKSTGFVNSLTVIRMVSSYLWRRVWGKPDTVAMYRSYYGGKNKTRSGRQ